jgi:hypothetical protein
MGRTGLTKHRQIPTISVTPADGEVPLFPLWDAAVKETSALLVKTTPSTKEDMVRVHPNDAYDIGLMLASVDARIYAGSSGFVEGRIHLDNACDMGTVQLNKRTVRNMGEPSKVRLAYKPSGSGAGDLFIKGA